MKKIKAAVRAAFAAIRAEFRKSPIVSTGAFLILLILGFWGIQRVLAAGIRRQETEAGLLTTRLQYRTSLIRNKDRVEKDLAGLETNWQYMKSRVFTEASDDIVFSRIQQSLERLATMRTISVKSYRFETTRRAGNFTVLPVSLEFSAPYEEALLFLNLIEGQPSFLKVAEIEMRSLGGDETLTIRMIVEGYRYYEKPAS